VNKEWRCVAISQTSIELLKLQNFLLDIKLLQNQFKLCNPAVKHATMPPSWKMVVILKVYIQRVRFEKSDAKLKLFCQIWRVHNHLNHCIDYMLKSSTINITGDGRCVLNNHQAVLTGCLIPKHQDPNNGYDNVSCRSNMSGQSECSVFKLWLQHERCKNDDCRYILYNHLTYSISL
jgi:hypothetical protein